ncbi:MAG: NFACT family protein [Fimbriimonadales bacterium]
MSAKFPFDSLVLCKIVEEAQIAVGGYVKKVAQLDEQTIVLRTGRAGENINLLICVNPQFQRAHLSRAAGNADLSGFGKALKERCDNARIEAITQNGFDRTLSITLSTRPATYRLIAEFFGPQANAYLVDENDRIAARMRRIGTRRVGEPYEFDTPKAADLNDAVQKGTGLSKLLAAELAQFGGDELLRRVREGVAVYSPAYGGYPFAPTTVDAPGLMKATTLSAAIESATERSHETDRISVLAKRLSAQLRRCSDAKTYALNQMLATVEDSERAREFQMRGEIILAHAHETAGLDQLDAIDYDGNQITIPLDARKSAAENAEKLFKKARRAKHGASVVKDQIPVRKKELAEIEAAMTALQDPTPDAVKRIEEIARSRGWLKEQHSGASERQVAAFGGKRIRMTTDSVGFTILWGENSEANDHLSTRIAKPNDIWLHVRANVGSHVLIQTLGKPERVQPGTIHAAARIAVLNSAQKHAKHVPVDYTLAKYVRKPKKSAPGFVTYTSEKTVYADGE